MGELHPVIERFYEATNNSSISSLAESLGIRRQAVYSAIKSGVFPKEWYFKVAEQTDFSMDWLVHGTGPKKRIKPGGSSLNAIPESIDSLCEFIVGSNNTSEKYRCKIRMCHTLESRKEEVKSQVKEERKRARINHLIQFGSKVLIDRTA